MTSLEPSSADPVTDPGASGGSVHHRRLDRVRKLGRVLDASIRIPGTSFRFGLDPIVGLIPGVGDAIGTVLSGYIVVEATRLGASLSVLFRMLSNIALEAIVGLIPGAGDAFDVLWKSNIRNLRLLERHLEDPDTTHVLSQRYLIVVIAGLALLAGVSIVGLVWLGRTFLRVLGL